MVQVFGYCGARDAIDWNRPRSDLTSPYAAPQFHVPAIDAKSAAHPLTVPDVGDPQTQEFRKTEAGMQRENNEQAISGGKPRQSCENFRLFEL